MGVSLATRRQDTRYVRGKNFSVAYSPKSRGACQERGTVAISYAGAVLAWGRVPGFCVAKKEHKQVRMVALAAGVGLFDELRDRMASERRSRTAELDVDIVLNRNTQGGSKIKWTDDRERYLSCRVKLDETSSQPSPCNVLVSYHYIAGFW